MTPITDDAEFVYFIQAGDDGPVKIGITRDPKKRLSYLQVGNHLPLRLIGLWPAADSEEEAFLHSYLEGERIRGEWYKPTTAVLDMAEVRT